MLDAKGLETRCPGGHKHVRIEGKFTKGSAVYVDGLGKHLARGFYDALRRKRILAEEDLLVDGFESIVSNDVLVASEWKTEKSWSWKVPRHINVLEVSASVAALEDAAVCAEDSREVFLVDSKVAQGALTKGRSSSYSLQPALKRACALQIACGLFPSWGFAPTRLNVADDPTRDVEPRSPWKHSLLGKFGLVELALLHMKGLRRFAANWLRLFILIVLPERGTCLDFGFCGSAFSSGSFGFSRMVFGCPSLDFDFVGGQLSSLSAWIFGLSLVWILCSFDSKFLVPPKWCRLVWWFVVPQFLFACAAMEPTSAAERHRAELRSRTELPADRVVRKETRIRRGQLLERFRSWLWLEKRVSLKNLMDQKPVLSRSPLCWSSMVVRCMLREKLMDNFPKQ